MNTIDQIVRILDEAATRGFLSQPVPSRYGGSMHQVVVFTEAEKKAIREFSANWHSVLRQIDYPISNLFGEEPSRTASLLSMLQYMISSEDTNPEYVAANAHRIQQSLGTHSEAWKSAEFANQMRQMGAQG